MKRIFCLVTILVTVVGFTQAVPLLSMSEKEDLLRELLQSKKFIDWFWGDDEEATTQPLTTTEEPEPVQINVAYGKGEGTSGLTSGQICGMAQALYPRSETVTSKRDLVLNMIYHVCLPSVGIDDLEAIGLIMSFLRQQEQQDINEPVVPTTPEPETLSPEWQMLLEHLAQAQDNTEEIGETAEEATTPAAATENAGAENAGAENAGAENTGDGNTGDEAGTGTDAGVDAGVEAAGDADANAGADGSTNGEEAKRLEDAEFLRLLLKAVELNSKN